MSQSGCVLIQDTKIAMATTDLYATQFSIVVGKLVMSK